MEIEKVKEIKKALEERTQHKPINCSHSEYVEACGMYCRHRGEFVSAIMGIKNEQTCENCNKFTATDKFKEYADILTLINELESENERWQKDCADIANDYQEMGNFYYEEVKKNQQLKDRIAELEKENADYKDTNNILRTRIDKSKELSNRNGELLLKQFAERLKEKMTVHYSSVIDSIDETLKDFINQIKGELK